MRRHLVLGAVIIAAVALVIAGYYVHVKLTNYPPAPSTLAVTDYSPERFHKVLSTTEKQHVLDGQFTIMDSTEKMPPALKQAFAAITGQQQFALANPGQKYQVTDVILEPGLPRRRLVFGGEGAKSWFIYYEHGGIGRGYAVVVFRKEPTGGVEFLWGGAGPSERAKDLDDLRKNIAIGNVRDDAVYYW